MRASLLFLPPKGRNPASQRNNPTRTLVDGGYIRKIGEGLYAFLPLGMLVLRNIVNLMQLELKRLGGQEVFLPMLNPIELWQATGRDRTDGKELFVLRDHKDRELVLTTTHEESMMELIKDVIKEAWQLPAFFYQLQSKARNVDASREGILKAREFLMLDGYSIHRSFSELNNFVPRLHHAFKRIFTVCGLSPLVSEGVSFYTGGDRSYDFVIIHRQGDYKVVTCEKCGSVADQQVAAGLSRISYSRPLGLEKAHKDGLEDLEDLTRVLGLPLSRIALTRVFACMEGFAMVVSRADQELSTHKVSRLLGDALVHELDGAAMTALGLVGGFSSPLGLDPGLLKNQGIRLVVDHLVAETPNLIMGGNRLGDYWINVNFGRDFEADLLGDLAKVDERNRCYHCGGTLKVRQALKLASIFRINDHYTRKLRITVGTDEGNQIHPHMGSYVMSLDRLIAAVATVYQDERGLRWPLQLAPYKAVLQVVGKSASLHRMALEIHDQLSEHILWDDRPLSFVTKCLDADRMGIPMRIIVSASSLRDRSVQVLSRTGAGRQRVPISRIKSVLIAYWREEREAAGFSEDP